MQKSNISLAKFVNNNQNHRNLQSINVEHLTAYTEHRLVTKLKFALIKSIC